MYKKSELNSGQKCELLHLFVKETFPDKKVGTISPKYALDLNYLLDWPLKAITVRKWKIECVYSPAMEMHNVYIRNTENEEMTPFYGVNTSIRAAYFEALVDVALHFINQKVEE